MKTATTLISSLLFCFSAAIASTVPGRYLQSCGYLTDKIFCYGGFGRDGKFHSDIIALNVQIQTTVNHTTLDSSWETIATNNSIASQGRFNSQFAVSSDRTKMFIDGGFTPFEDDSLVNALLENSFIVFDAEKNTWEQLPSYQQYGLKDPQVYGATVTFVTDINQLVFFGGMMDNRNNISVQVDGVATDADMPYFDFGYHNLTTFDIDQKKWVQLNNSKGQDTNHFYSGSNVVYVPDNHTNFYFGGWKSNRTNTSDYSLVPFNELSRVSFPEYVWDYPNCTGDIPQIRDVFTTTLLPDGKTVLLYGGIDIDGRAIRKNCYLLDIPTLVWSECVIEVPPNVISVRMAHSAVLVGNYLYMLFGLDEQETPLNDLMILDVSDPKNITYSATYTYTDTIYTPALQAEESSGLGAGAIAGIVVGCVVAVAAALGVWFLLAKKKKKAVSRTESREMAPYQDWDVANIPQYDGPRKEGNVYNDSSKEEVPDYMLMPGSQRR